MQNNFDYEYSINQIKKEVKNLESKTRTDIVSLEEELSKYSMEFDAIQIISMERDCDLTESIKKIL